MTNHKTPGEVYNHQADLHATALKQLKIKKSNLGWLRLILGLAVISIIYYLFFNSSLVVWVTVAIAIAIFLSVVSIDADNNAKIAGTERLLDINNQEVAILAGDYYKREDGHNYLPEEHPYAADIDLFGRASIYQYINRCTSEQSKKSLASLLLHSSEKSSIPERQEAAKALAEHIEWRQELQSSGMATPVTLATEQRITSWLNMPAPLTHNFWKVLPHVFTTITLGVAVAYIFDWIPSAAFSFLVFIFFLVALLISAKVNTTYLALSKLGGELNTVEQQLRQVEVIPASSSLLDSYKHFLLSEKKGSGSIKELKEIIQRFDYRLNVFVFVVLNTFLLWDVRQTNSLVKWKAANGTYVPQWFSILANIEILNTLAAITFNHPGWVFPVINNAHFTFSGEDVGHPLIDEKKRVNNSFETKGTGKVSVITGSNMAGKSTFLRSIAVNLVLAQIGAPVCAKRFTFSPVKLYSSMRIADNLAENTSTFYAELKKLKSIIDQVKQHEKVFILLDEILRGTNSLDRHTGSEALIKQLIREQAVAVIATHDVELAALENEFSNAITNYHFDVQVEGEELYFDYKLKGGVCQSMNASLLMKKIGIEI
ncbi:MAG: hypothetical protein JWQ40_230 [Segetibacter sp.]|nr:hypothetical protein [Segetibacter sp.]